MVDSLVAPALLEIGAPYGLIRQYVVNIDIGIKKHEAVSCIFPAF